MKKIYIDICDNFKKFLKYEGSNKHKHYKNKLIKKLFEYKKIIKYNINIKLNSIRDIEYKNKKMYIIYAKDDSKKIEKKINKLLNVLDSKKNIILLSNTLLNKIELSKEIYIKQYLENRKTDKTIFKHKIIDVLDYLLNLRNEISQMTDIYILIKQYSDKYKNIILKLAQKYKTINIITYDIYNFQMLEEEIYNVYGIYIIIANNKRKSLIKSEYIINVDYTEEIINQYKINRNAVIINISKNSIKKIIGFYGIIINNIICIYNKLQFDDYEKCQEATISKLVRE